MKRTLATLLTGAMIATPLAAAQARCGLSDGDMALLKTAALQQELMVAALSCHDIRGYNRFVRAHQAELLDADAALMTFFARRDSDGGTAGYNAFKTELANAASLSSARDVDAFCYDADAEFDFVLRPLSLASIVERDRLIVPVSYPACREPAPSTTLALAEPPPARTRPPAARVIDAGTPPFASGDRTPASTPGDPPDQAATRADLGAVATPAPHRGLDTTP